MNIHINDRNENLVIADEWIDPDLQIDLQESDEVLAMDLYFPNLIKGKDGEEIVGKRLLREIQAIDGEGSGIDADTLDGWHASAFLLKRQELAGRLLAANADGELADGGNADEFKEAFINCLPIELQ